MLWLNFIHLYQPANMEREKLLEATENCYEKLLLTLEQHPHAKMTANIAGSLLERWTTDLNRLDLIERYRIVIASGQLEIVGSAAYHALLPLVSLSEVKAQILEQERLLLKYFGISRPRGFFLPEMAYGSNVAKLIKKIGYEWIIVDEMTANGRLGDASGLVFVDLNSQLKVVSRDRFVSESYVPETLIGLLKASTHQVVVTGTDAELYGLRHVDHKGELNQILSSELVTTKTISEYIDSQNEISAKSLIDSNWQTTDSELLANNPYSLWSDNGNQVQADLWKLSNLAQKLFYKYQKDDNIWWSRWHLWRGLASCSWWWASRKDFREVFGPLAWSPDEVEKGTVELIRAIRSLESSTDRATKLKAEKLAQKIRTNVWLKHWQ